MRRAYLFSALLLGCSSSSSSTPDATDDDATSDALVDAARDSIATDARSEVTIDATDACLAKTCAGEGVACGAIDDGCGKKLDCGACGDPKVEAVEVVTTNAEVQSDAGAPGNWWGGHQSRIVRTSKGDVYTAYFVAGSAVDTSEWHVALRTPSGWNVVAKGLAGREPVHLLRGPDDTLYVVAWNVGAHLWTSSGSGASIAFSDAAIPGDWSPRTGASTPYMGAGIDDRGDLCVFESDAPDSATTYGKPGFFLRSCRSASDGTWHFESRSLDYRHCYTYVLPQSDGSLIYTSTRDVVWNALGYTQPTGAFGYVFNEVAAWRGAQVGGGGESSVVVVENAPTSTGQDVSADQRDAYLDSKGRLHVLYERTSGTTVFEMRHAILNGTTVVKDVLLADRTPTGWTDGYFRMIEDTTGKLYWLYGNQGDVFVYPSTSDDGSTLGAPVTLSFGDHPVLYSGITWAAPRGGTRISDWIEAAFPSGSGGEQWIYARVRLR